MTEPVFPKLLAFKSLPKGWCYGEGGPISDAIYDEAIQLITAALSYGFQNLNVFPGLDGEVRLAIYRESEYLEFTIETDYSVTFMHEVHGHEVEYAEKMSFMQAIQELENNKENPCILFGYSTPNITTNSGSDTRASLSGLLLTAASPFFLSFAQ